MVNFLNRPFLRDGIVENETSTTNRRGKQTHINKQNQKPIKGEQLKKKDMTSIKIQNPNESRQCRLCGEEKDESKLIQIESSVDKQLIYEILEVQVSEPRV